MISAVILASGYSNRMGRNKLLLPYKKKPIVEHVIDAILSCNFSNIILVGRDVEVINIGKRKNIKTVINSNATNGQSESVKLSINNLPNTDGYMFFTGDQPLIELETIELLLHKFNQNNNFIIVPKHKEKKGTPVIFPKEFKQELLSLEGDTGGRVIINNNLDKVIFVDLPKEHVLFDIDTPDDYKTLISMQ